MPLHPGHGALPMRVAVWALIAGLGGLLPPIPARSAPPPAILVLGDSLSAAYGIELARGWVGLLEARLAGRYRVVNAGLSGDTSKGGRQRLPQLLMRHHPRWVVVELGGNDGLRGVPLQETRRNLRAIIRLARRAGARVVLAGMRLPPNYGPAYTERFHAMYGELARQEGVSLVPFLLAGVAGVPGRMQDDGIHPTAAAQPRILENLWAVLGPLLGSSGTAAMR